MLLNLGLISLLSTASLQLLLSPAAATDIHWSRNSCAGDVHWKINNARQNQCYYNNSPTAAITFYYLPGGAKGQLYSGGINDQCMQYAGETRSSGTCIFFGPGAGIRSVNWFYPYKRLVRKEEEPLEPTRYSVSYELPDSTPREIEIPTADFDSVLKLVDARDYHALAKFPTYIRA